MRKLQNENGNTMLFTLGMLSIMMIMFLFVVNLTKVLAVKENSNTSSQQASLAATSVLYEELWDRFSDYEELPELPEMPIIPEPPDLPELPELPIIKSLGEKIIEREQELEPKFAYRHYSEKELHIEAIDQVISEEIRSPKGKKLKRELELEMTYQILPEVKAAAREAIIENDGNIENAELFIRHNRIEVRASNSIEASTFGNFFKGINDKLFQTSAGPEITFLSYLSGWDERTEALD
jgi:hypothetical protein